MLALDDEITDDLIMYNYHAYMNPDNPKALKNVDSLEISIQEIISQTSKPIILTEFGQFCCETDGKCGLYEGTWGGEQMGYAEAIVRISQQYAISWTPWAWRPGASKNPNPKC